jgi:ferredoxin-NADP reductase
MHGVEGHYTLDLSERILASVHKIAHGFEDGRSREWWKILLLSGGIGNTPNISILNGLNNMRNRALLSETQCPDIVFVQADCYTRNISCLSTIKTAIQKGLVKKVAFVISRQSSNDEPNEPKYEHKEKRESSNEMN